MAFPYLAVFGGLLLLYLGYSYWQRFDPRYPVAAGLLLLVVTALVEAGGATSAADTLAEYVFLLLLGGAVLLLAERFRSRPGRRPASGSGALPAEEHPAEPTDERQGPSDHPLDHVQEQPVAPVDAARGQDDEDEGAGDGEPDHG